MREKKRTKIFEQAIEPYYEDIFRFIMSLTNKDAELSKDLTQSTMEKAWYKLDRLKNKDSVKSWLFTIANNEVKLYLRAKGSKKHSLYEETPFSECEEYIGTCEVEILDNMIDCENKRYAILALNKIKEDYRIILEMKISMELEYSEISKILDMNEATVRTKYRRGLILLRKEFDNVSRGEKDE